MCLVSVSKIHKPAIHKTGWQKGYKVTNLVAFKNHFGFYSGYALPGTKNNYYGKFDHVYHNPKPSKNYSPEYPLGFHILKTVKDAEAYGGTTRAKLISTLTDEYISKLLVNGNPGGTKDYGTYFIIPVLYRKVVATGNQAYSSSASQHCDIALEMKVPCPAKLSPKVLAKILPKLQLIKAKAEFEQAKLSKKRAVSDLTVTKKREVQREAQYQKYYVTELKQAKKRLEDRIKQSKDGVKWAERNVVTSDKELVRATRAFRSARKAASKRTTKAK